MMQFQNNVVIKIEWIMLRVILQKKKWNLKRKFKMDPTIVACTKDLLFNMM